MEMGQFRYLEFTFNKVCTFEQVSVFLKDVVVILTHIPCSYMPCSVYFRIRHQLGHMALVDSKIADS